MNERELVQAWHNAWNRIILAQIAPTALLITTVALLQFGLAEADFAVRGGAALILLASGILGALAEFGAADEASGISRELAALSPASAVSKRIAFQAKLLPVVKFVTPAIFVAIFVYLVAALHLI
jgi:hypothetical protein